MQISLKEKFIFLSIFLFLILIPSVQASIEYKEYWKYCNISISLTQGDYWPNHNLTLGSVREEKALRYIKEKDDLCTVAGGGLRGQDYEAGFC